MVVNWLTNASSVNIENTTNVTNITQGGIANHFDWKWLIFPYYKVAAGSYPVNFEAPDAQKLSNGSIDYNDGADFHEPDVIYCFPHALLNSIKVWAASAAAEGHSFDFDIYAYYDGQFNLVGQVSRPSVYGGDAGDWELVTFAEKNVTCFKIVITSSADFGHGTIREIQANAFVPVTSS